MAYQIKGLDPADFAHLVGLSDNQLIAHGAVRMTADRRPGFPCRVSLEDVEEGATLLLLNHISHGEVGPYRASHAIFVGEGSAVAGRFQDEVPPALDGRILSLRAFDGKSMMIDAALVQPGEADAAIRTLLGDCEVDHIDAHNAVRGCFAARIDRS